MRRELWPQLCSLLPWLGKPGNPRAWSQELGWLQRGALGTRNETGSWAVLRSSGMAVIYSSPRAAPAQPGPGGSLVWECQSSASAAWSLSPGWDRGHPKQSPSIPNFCCIPVWAHHWLRFGHCVAFLDAKEPLQHHLPACLGLARLLLRVGCSIFQGFLSLPGAHPGTPIPVLRAGVKEAPQGSVLGSEEVTEKGHNNGMVYRLQESLFVPEGHHQSPG